MSRNMRFPTMWYVRPAKPPIRRAVWSEPLLATWIFSEDELLTEHHLVFLSLKGGCTGSSESTLVKMTHCWKSRVTTHMHIFKTWPKLKDRLRRSYWRSCHTNYLKSVHVGRKNDLISKDAKIRNRYNQVPHLTQDTSFFYEKGKTDIILC